MMIWELPKSVEIDGDLYKIRNDCDYRVVLDVISALNDKDLPQQNRAECALFIFYENIEEIKDGQKAFDKMMNIINLGKEMEENEPESPKLIDWEHDFNNIAPPISRVLGYSIRDSANYTHWYDFIGAYMEIGDCYFAQITSYRNKRVKGKKLDEQDREFYREHKKDIDFPIELSESEQEWLDSDF